VRQNLRHEPAPTPALLAVSTKARAILDELIDVEQPG
jgi:hypothetical protein